MKKGKGKKRKSKAMYAAPSALLFKTMGEAEAYLRSAGWGTGGAETTGMPGTTGTTGMSVGMGTTVVMGESACPQPAHSGHGVGQQRATGRPGVGSKTVAGSRAGARAGAGAGSREWG